MSASIVPIVEGHAEVRSIPILLRRILHEQLGEHRLLVAQPWRVQRTKIAQRGQIEGVVVQAARAHDDAACLLVILDADDDCPAELAPQLLQRCRSATRLPAAVVLANREFEAWFLGAKESLRGTRGIRHDASSPPDPEAVRGAKERLSSNMDDRGYLGPDDQPALVAEMDLQMARRNCPSFDKLLRDVRRLIEQVADCST